MNQHAAAKIKWLQIYEVLLARMWSLPIKFAKKSVWRTITVCDISPGASQTSESFRNSLLRILEHINAADDGAAELIAQNIRCIANASPLRGICSYNHAGKLFLINWNALKKDFEGDVLLIKAAVLLFNSATTGRFLSDDPELFGHRERDAVVALKCEREAEVFRARMTSAIAATSS